MADSIASPLLQLLLNRLDSISLSFIDGDDQILTRARTVVATTKDLATAAEQRFDTAPEIKRWLTDVKRLTYQFNYLLDDYEQEMLMVKNQKLMSCCFRSFVPRIVNRRRIELVLEKLSARSGEGDWPLESNWKRDLYFRLNSFPNSLGSLKPYIVGRNLDRDKIISLLLNETQKKCHVVPVVGAGGLGKTTLARLVYDDEAVGRNFGFKYWVSLANDLRFNVGRIGEAICSRKFSSFVDLLDGIRKELIGKRFLVVLDNLCIEEMDLRIELMKSFNVGSSGSVVIITTRGVDVADGLGNVPLYYLQPLSDADCLDMFRELALLPWEEWEEDQNTELLQISKSLVANCSGLPLAVEILGALLPYNGETGDWLAAAALALVEFQKYNYTSDILPVLHLSYDLLPSYLKQCFAYCSIFPRGYWISKEKLLQLWNAEGFLRTSGSSKSFDDIAEECFTQLLQRLFFEEIVSDDSGNICCRMHDVVHDFVLTLGSTTCAAIGTASLKNVSEELSHCSLVFESEPSEILRYLSNKEDLQTLLFLSSKFESIPDSIFSRLSHLHVLDFSQSGIFELPVSLGALKHLRYLDVSRTYIRKIPETISNLKYLQTLELSDCYNLEELPKTFPQVTNLVNLGISSCCSLTSLPSGIGKLRLLQKLPTFVLGKGSNSAKLNELRELDLKERLDIKNLENVTNVAEARGAKLFKKVSIHSLGLSWGHNDIMNAHMSELVLENLDPPQNLRDFCLKGYKGSRFPSWMNSGLPNLSSISLINCCCRVLPPLGQLPSLKFLYLKGMPEVRSIGHEFYGDGGFPCLEQFEIYDMPNLEKWKSIEMKKTEIFFSPIEGSSGPSSLEAFPCLDILVVKGCHRLTALPVIPNLRSLALCDSNEMLLRSAVQLPLLSSLVLENIKLEFLTCYFESLFSIEKLTLYNCDHLDYLFEDNQASFSLKHLSILYCDSLMSLPRDLRSLTSLQSLHVMECGQLNDISVLESLSSLEELSIVGCPMLYSIPSGIITLQSPKVGNQRMPCALQRHLEIEYGKD